MRKPINKISDKRKKEMALYRKKKAAYMYSHPFCECCMEEVTDLKAVIPKADHLHHIRGRSGKMLNDERYFMSVCAHHHRYIHDRPADARLFGWLAQKGQWLKAD